MHDAGRTSELFAWRANARMRRNWIGFGDMLENRLSFLERMS